MARTSGLERNQAPWHLRWFYGVMRKMFGRDLTPAKVQMRYPEWSGAQSQWKRASAENVACLCGLRSWQRLGPLLALDVHFE